MFKQYLSETGNPIWFGLLIILICYVNITYAQGRPDVSELTKVYMTLFVVDIDEVDGAEQKFSANFYYIARWQDKRLAHSHTDKLSYPITKVWTPRLQIANQQRIWSTFPEVVTVDQAGNVTYRQRVWGDFSQPLKLREFPFDKQTFTINLVSASYAVGEIELVPLKDEPSGIAHKFSVPDWEITGWDLKSGPYHFRKEGTGVPSISISVHAKRYIGYYALMYIIPLLLIVCMSLIAFWIDIKEANTRISIAITSMLTLIAYRFIIAANLPKVSYLTRMDMIILAATLLVFLSLMLNALISSLISNNKITLAKKVDFHSRWLLPLIFILVIVIPMLPLS